jgi:hypothetical protein
MGAVTIVPDPAVEIPAGAAPPKAAPSAIEAATSAASQRMCPATS